MSGQDQQKVGFVLSLRAETPEIAAAVAEELRSEMAARGTGAQCLDMPRLAREAYRRVKMPGALGWAVGLACETLLASGQVVILHGSSGPADRIAWHGRQPENLLEVHCGPLDEEKEKPTGPVLILKPLPEEAAPVETGSVGDAESEDPEEGEQETAPLTRYNLAPLLTALTARGWLPGEQAESATPPEEDAAIRERLKKLGYL